MVVKRGGKAEVFETAKLRRCLAAGMEGCDCDTRLADALARAVKLHLRDWTGAAPPTTDYVFRCVRAALMETGLECAALKLSRHRRQRAARRRKLIVLDNRACGAVRVPWRKAAVAQTLETLYELGHSVARILAGEIERQVLGLEYDVISTALIAELTRSELLAWGLADAGTMARPEVDAVGIRQTKKEC